MSYKNKNSKYKKSNTSKTRSKLIKLTAVVVCLLFVSATVLYFADRSSKKENSYADSGAKTTSLAPSAQEDFTSGDERPVSESNPDKGEAYVTDSQGNVSNVTDQSQWTRSQSGEITVYSPTTNQLINNSDVLSGESSLPKVSFRIIDDVSGVISTGELSVVNGKFSGNLSFTTTASAGRVDIFGAREDGSEFSNVEVGVRFK
jgi:cytoskeletal protein RodZ